VTGTAPARFDAPVLRFQQPENPSAPVGQTKITGQWIWSQAASKSVPAGETITVRRKFDTKPVPHRAVAAISCDNQYTMYLNGKRVLSGENWESVDLVNLQPHLKEGSNELLIVAKNGGSDPNPAGLLFEARLAGPQGSSEVIATDAQWQWTKSQPDGRGRFSKPPADWEPTAVVQNAEGWNKRVGPQFVAMLEAAANSTPRMVRASLMKNDAFMTALGRPTRDQIVSMRPSELTTLEAIDLANGQTLADAIARGAEHLVERFHLSGESSNPESTPALVRWLYAYALSRQPNAEELALAQDLLGDRPASEKIEDLLWSVFMLPEFQLIR
jgi:hypothetical protein